MLAQKKFYKGRENLVCDDENPVKMKRIKCGFQMMMQMVMRMLTQVGIFSTKSTDSLALSKKNKKFFADITDTHEL